MEFNKLIYSKIFLSLIVLGVLKVFRNFISLDRFQIVIKYCFCCIFCEFVFKSLRLRSIHGFSIFWWRFFSPSRGKPMLLLVLLRWKLICRSHILSSRYFLSEFNIWLYEWTVLFLSLVGFRHKLVPTIDLYSVLGKHHQIQRVLFRCTSLVGFSYSFR